MPGNGSVNELRFPARTRRTRDARPLCRRGSTSETIISSPGRQIELIKGLGREDEKKRRKKNRTKQPPADKSSPDDFSFRRDRAFSNSCITLDTIDPHRGVSTFRAATRRELTLDELGATKKLPKSPYLVFPIISII